MFAIFVMVCHQAHAQKVTPLKTGVVDQWYHADGPNRGQKVEGPIREGELFPVRVINDDGTEGAITLCFFEPLLSKDQPPFLSVGDKVRVFYVEGEDTRYEEPYRDSRICAVHYRE